MAELTTDPRDPRLTHGVDRVPTPQADVYLVLSEEERAAGFVRPLRDSYRHLGPPGPRYPTRDLDPEEQVRYAGAEYVQYEPYPESKHPALGRFWTQAQLDAAVVGGCGTVTSMGRALAETYARQPLFYGATYCVHCQKHLPVDEFRWVLDDEVVGS